MYLEVIDTGSILAVKETIKELWGKNCMKNRKEGNKVNRFCFLKEIGLMFAAMCL